MSALLELQGVSVYYDQVAALRGLDLTVAEGELVVVLGSNGAGKTTTLRAISGMVHPRQGQIRFMGRRIDRTGPARITRSGIAHVPEGRRIFPEHTVEENLELGGYPIRRDRATYGAALDDVFDLFPRLAERRSQQAGTLSGGEAQMLAVARALVSRPRLLMLDEPSLGLAPQLAAEMFGYLVELHRSAGLTILLVEQQAATALAMADRGYVLDGGRLALSGSSRELRDDPGVQEIYLGGRVT